MKLKHKIAYMNSARAFAECSISTRLKVGCVIVKNNSSVWPGYNALPQHLDGPLEDENGNTKLEVRHAEDNALRNVMKSNSSTHGASMFCTHSCCKYCAIDIVDAGIKEFHFVDSYRSWEGIEHLLKHEIKVYRWMELPYNSRKGDFHLLLQDDIDYFKSQPNGDYK